MANAVSRRKKGQIIRLEQLRVGRSGKVSRLKGHQPSCLPRESGTAEAVVVERRSSWCAAPAIILRQQSCKGELVAASATNTSQSERLNCRKRTD
eukprot:1157071-Pleurochrysis_carterae.AAC.2